MSEADKRTRFEEMFRLTYERVLAYALRRAERADADDVVAETYAIAWRRFESMPADPLPWLYGVARRTLANSRRSARRRSQLATRLAGETSRTPVVEADHGDRLDDASVMRAALMSLREDDREVLMLVAWEGLDNEGAAAVLEISSQAFAVRLHRARARLQAEIDRSVAHPPIDGDMKEQG